ncbi:hypothetical protein [Acetonema longum]|uniref:Uncharacterized protein n=1 Tax=Acetonema longum DSM 6540 TaxID=1009370 RepID=F7NN14_9FIRM|nr:hypothetical protein [Acetonema longum]EGO62592.1 hypothetical protein ALO_17486 [Acetonema longum DSM 6540]
MKKNANITTFGENFSEMFLSRIAYRETFAPLQDVDAYQAAKEEYNNAYNEVAQQGPKALERLLRAIHRVQDFEQEYLYRLGFQEGVRSQSASFLIDGLR